MMKGKPSDFIMDALILIYTPVKLWIVQHQCGEPHHLSLPELREEIIPSMLDRVKRRT